MTLAALLFAAGALYLLALFYSVFLAVPFVGSSWKRVDMMVTLADIRAGDMVVDLGSGDGRIVFAAARAGAVATGIEQNPLLVWYCRLVALGFPKARRPRFIRGSFFAQPLGGYAVVFAYLFPEVMARLAPKLRAELAPGSRVVANAFALPGWESSAQAAAIHCYTA